MVRSGGYYSLDGDILFNVRNIITRKSHVFARNVLSAQKFNQFACLCCLTAPIHAFKQYERTSLDDLTHVV